MPVPRDFEGMWRDMKAALQQMRDFMRNPLANSGLTQTAPGEISVDGKLNVEGGEVQSGDFVAGASGWHLGSDGNAEFNDITIRDLPNSALANPVVPDAVNQVATNFAIPGTSYTTIVSAVMTVPADCTRLLVHITGDAFVVNPNTTGGSNGAGSDIIIARCTAESDTGLAMGTSISGSNGQTSVHCSLASLLSGLTPGGTVTLTVEARSGFQSFGGANPSNQANLSGTLTWLR